MTTTFSTPKMRPTRSGPLVSTITYLTRSGTSVGIAFDTFTLRPAPNSLTVFPTWSISVSPPDATSKPVASKPNTRAIVGGVIGACALLIAVAIALICVRRGRPSHRRNARSRGRWHDLEGKKNRSIVPDSRISPHHCENAKVLVLNTDDPIVNSPHPKDKKTQPHGVLFNSESPFVQDKTPFTPDPFVDPKAPLERVGQLLGKSPSVCDTALEMDTIPRQMLTSGPL